MITTDPHDTEAPALSDAQEAWDAGRDRCVDDLQQIHHRLSCGLYGLFWDNELDTRLCELIMDVESLVIPTEKELTEQAE